MLPRVDADLRLGNIGISGGTGHVAESGGEAIHDLTMDGRMTIEGGARAGMIAPDETTFAYMEGRPFVPRGKAFEDAVAGWKKLSSDDGAKFDMARSEGARAASYLGHEPRHGNKCDRTSCLRKNAAQARQTAISRAAKARIAARIWLARSWPQRQPSRAAL